MAAFQERGDFVGIFCVDSAMAKPDQVMGQVESSGYVFRDLLGGVYLPDVHGWDAWRNRRRLGQCLSAMWRDIDVDCFVIGSLFGDVRKTIVNTAVAMGIPIVHICDGLIVPGKRRPLRILKRRPLHWGLLPALWSRLGFRSVRSDSCPDLMLLLNQSGRDEIINDGFPADKVKVVGSPMHDRLAVSCRQPVKEAHRSELAERLGLPTGRPVVFFAAQETNEYDHKLAISHMIPAIAQSGSILLVKFHPREPIDLKEWRQWAERSGYGADRIVFSRNELTSFDALHLCEVCVTCFSTVSVEAMIMGRPVVYIQYMEEAASSMPYASRSGAGIDANTPEELQSAIMTLLRDKVVRQQIIERGYVTVKDELAGLDGGSIRRTLDAICTLVSQRAGRV